MLILDLKTPWLSAKSFIEAGYKVSGLCTLHYHTGVFYAWMGTHYRSIDTDTIRSEVYKFLETARQVTVTNGVTQFDPTRARVNDVIDALKAATNLPSDVQPPAWLRDGFDLLPTDIVACQNGLLHLPTRRLYPHTPDLFVVFALPFSYDPHAAAPNEWLSFLNSLWGADTEAIETLQEIFGYCLTADTSQQKLFLILGPKRSGKGTIATVLTALLGEKNVVAPTLAGIQTNFGLAPLIGKPLAVISDARLSSRADQKVIAERLLSISGEDSLTIDRKNISPWTGRLPTRFLILTNELPRLTDASGALASRIITLALKKSFYNKEDHGLKTRLLAELPSILNWALDGRDRLVQFGYFEPPQSSAEVEQELEDLGSPISAFLRDNCEVGAGKTVEVGRLFSAWKSWCTDQGRDYPGTVQSFGRDLRAAVPGLRVVQPREGETRDRYYEGVGLIPPPPRPARGGTRT